MSTTRQPDSIVTIAVKGEFNAGWLWACLGMQAPSDASIYFRDGFDTAMETPSLETMRFIMGENSKRGDTMVTIKTANHGH